MILVDGVNSEANAVLRFGGDFDLGEHNAETWGRTRLVNNTIVVTGRFGNAGAPLLRAFGRPEGLIAHNNLVVVADRADARVLFLHEDDSNLAWAARDGRPRVLMTHNVLPAGSTLLRDRALKAYTVGDTAPAASGYAWSDTRVTTAPPLAPGALAGVTPAALRLAAGSALRAAGTTATNTPRHPVDAQHAFDLPGALALPTRNAAFSAVPGAARGDAASPTPGAFD